MLDTLQCLTLIATALALVPALAHALELPGKTRLSREEYRTVQPIYYPGFTVAGFFEPAAVLAALILLVATPTGTGAFWLTLFTLFALIGMHSIYWLVTHPVNKAWLEGEKLGRAGKTFFDTAAGGAAQADWTALRDRWEHSHVARAALASAGFVALAIAVAAE